MLGGFRLFILLLLNKCKQACDPSTPFLFVSSKRNRVEPERKSDQGAFAGPLEPRRAGRRSRRAPCTPWRRKRGTGVRGAETRTRGQRSARPEQLSSLVSRSLNFYPVATGSLCYEVSRRSHPASAGQRTERATRAFLSSVFFSLEFQKTVSLFGRLQKEKWCFDLHGQCPCNPLLKLKNPSQERNHPHHA